jgi:predicted ABC-class ATPase
MSSTPLKMTPSALGETEPELSPNSLIRRTKVVKNSELQRTMLEKREIAAFLGNGLR